MRYAVLFLASACLCGCAKPPVVMIDPAKVHFQKAEPSSHHQVALRPISSSLGLIECLMFNLDGSIVRGSDVYHPGKFIVSCGEEK